VRGVFAALPLDRIWEEGNCHELVDVHNEWDPLEEVIETPMPLTHSRVFGGGFHCVTLDVRRRGSLETYS
jgi:hypothetical protein